MSSPSGKGHVIVFDPVAQTVSTEKVKNLGDFQCVVVSISSWTKTHLPGEPIIKQPTPKWSSHAHIYVDTNSTEPGLEIERRLVATVNLDKLGWTMKIKRLCGRRSEIYVMELPHQKDPRMLS